MDALAQLPESEELYKDSYTVLAGRWPQSWNECVMVMESDGGTTDLALYVMGLRDTVEMEDMISQFIGGEEVSKPEIEETYTYDDFLGTTFKVVNSTDYYKYDSQYQVWADKTDDRRLFCRVSGDGRGEADSDAGTGGYDRHGQPGEPDFRRARELYGGGGLFGGGEPVRAA
ncbi:MAG: hypothetical protein LUF32_01835 [Clostridiales bacterium]|nr:hypothetical protein [Clostridiales bacterium]